ncbi:SURF1 family protein [Psychrobium sp. 1_MG-2023]|uniref:SURF1 family protein n=1 Tax=Psychrobium sp. 1_MG-2023 TaxID=3062624 RepID=UPI000C3305F5|nr:SURF1 family protein [Psychrobium sp. 1_MG-2023]MDP2561832.1 SURF1 family protein [Psychrobium sp. 1_MG-2023]PKF55796.1 hypothetical protein CW748_11685 [Alteromonadales bacterium alter-6D02]
MVKRNYARLLLPLLVIIALLLMLVRLGLWQLERAGYKQDYLERLAQRQTVSLSTLPTSQNVELNKQAVNLTGTLLHDYTLLLDNVVEQGVVGYQVLVPMQLSESSQQLVLVNLGWVKANLNRDVLPQLSQWSGELQVEGYIHQPSDNPFLSVEPQLLGWPKIIGEVDFSVVETWLHAEKQQQILYPAIVRVKASQPIGYSKQWRWVNGMTVAKHHGYAVQWFALALTLFILSVHFFRRTLRRGHEAN